MTPPLPQAIPAVPVWHWVPLQQPPGQLAALQTQTPPTQAWPTPHAAFVPHLQTPAAQVSVVAAGQAKHALPWFPHLSAEGVRHWLFSQQPPGQLAALQTQVPPTQRWPAPQAALVPHLQTPATQTSVDPVWQEEQTAPLVPQEVALETWQTPLKQQPLGQVVWSHPVQVPA
jgi:hypothetical protein